MRDDHANLDVMRRVHRTPEHRVEDRTMLAISTIRIDHHTLPAQFDRSRPDAVADAIEAALRDDGITAEASDLITHIKVEVPTTQLAAASRALTAMGLI
jgi:hypothetical protein